MLRVDGYELRDVMELDLVLVEDLWYCSIDCVQKERLYVSYLFEQPVTPDDTPVIVILKLMDFNVVVDFGQDLALRCICSHHDALKGDAEIVTLRVLVSV